MKRLSLLVSLVFVFCLLLVVGTTMAQGSPAAADSGGTSGISISNIISFLIGGLVSAIGILAALGSAARQVLQDPAKIVLAEKLGDSVPVAHANQLLTAMGDIRALVREATDRKPAYSKTPEEKAALYSGDPVPATLS